MKKKKIKHRKWYSNLVTVSFILSTIKHIKDGFTRWGKNEKGLILTFYVNKISANLLKIFRIRR